MLKYYEYAIVTAEFPDEITLAINITNCIGHCEGCSEPWLLKDIGTELTFDEITSLIDNNPGISCFGFMGGDSDPFYLLECAQFIHKKYPSLKVGMYSGQDYINLDLAQELDYYKIGRFILPKPIDKPEEWWKQTCGPITFPFSNQKMYKKINNKLVDITHRFRENKLNSPESLKKQII